MPLPTALYYSILQYQPENLQFLREHCRVIEILNPDADRDEILAEIDLCFAPLGFYLGRAKMKRCSRLRAIATNTTGVPHIDMEEAAARGIKVISLKDETEFLRTITSTAEHTWGLLLALMRRSPWAHADVLKGQWNRRPFGTLRMLSRLSLGIIGCGRLGSMVGRYGLAFGMQVAYFDPYLAESPAGFKRMGSLEDLVAFADVVSLHAPADETTYKMISRDLLWKFKPGSYFINTARGELVDEAALLETLKTGRLAGAALDVLDGEFVPGFQVSSHPLVAYAWEHDNLLLTPHIGGSTIDAWGETERRVIELAYAYLREGK
ncbi:MAG: hydroxyacid dehydrogenase [Deltaproteobacteria bacterium]|nr:MAG: hydroxyacid dehydrogenase [Deltaproteobacteria bacterium]